MFEKQQFKEESHDIPRNALTRHIEGKTQVTRKARVENRLVSRDEYMLEEREIKEITNSINRFMLHTQNGPHVYCCMGFLFCAKVYAC